MKIIKDNFNKIEDFFPKEVMCKNCTSEILIESSIDIEAPAIVKNVLIYRLTCPLCLSTSIMTDNSKVERDNYYAFEINQLVNLENFKNRCNCYHINIEYLQSDNYHHKFNLISDAPNNDMQVIEAIVDKLIPDYYPKNN